MATKNPLYPGYHPGEKIERYPSSRYREYKGEYTPSKFNEYLEKLGDGEGFNIPKWAWEQEKGALEMAWQANFYGTELVSPTEASVGGEEEIEDISGAANVGVTLNPAEWIKDPKKQAKNFFVKPIESIFDPNDFRQKAKETAWRTRLMKDKDSPFHLQEGVEARELKDEKKVTSQIGEKYGIDPDYSFIRGSPKFEKKQGVYGDNLYQDAASSVSNYMGNSHSIFFRNGKFRDFNKNVLSALDTELEVKSSRLKGALSQLEEKKLEDFRDRIRVLDAFDNLGVAGGTGKKGGKTLLVDGKKLKIGGSDVSSIEHSLSQVIDTYNKSFFKSKIDSREWKTIRDNLEGLKESLDHANGLLEKLEKSGAKDIKGLKKYTESLEKQLSKAFVEKDGKLVLRDNLGKGFFNSLEVQKKRMYRNTVDGGVVGGFMRGFVEENITNRNSEINKILNVKDSSSNSTIMSNASRRLSSVSDAVNRDWRWQSAGAVADAITEGKLPNQFIWFNVIAPRIEKWTPSYIVNQGLKRSHYFGLMVDKDVLKGDLKANFIGEFVMNHPSLSLIKSNRFRMVIDGKTHVFSGGDHFESVLEVAKLFHEDSSFSAQNLLDFLNEKSFARFFKEDYDNLAKLRQQLLDNDKLREAMGIGVKGNTFIFIKKDRVKKFFNKFTEKELLELGISPTYEKLGLVQRYGSFVSKWRAKFYNNWIGQIYKKFSGWQEILKQKIAEIISSLIAKAFTALTGGLGVAIDWLVKIIAQVIVKRIEQFVKKFWKALKSFDFSEILEDVEESFYKGIKGCLIFSSFTVLPVVGIVLFIVISIVSIFPNFNAGRIGVDQTGMGILFNRDFFMANCGDEVELPSEAIGANSSSSSVARAAFDIVEDLERGFWCYFNKSPDYPELFRDTLFSINPFPPASVASNTWNLLFWCTFLPWKSGADIPPDQYCYNPSTGDAVSRYRADGMQYCYQNAPGNRYVSANEAYVTSSGGNVQSNISAGDVIFINSGDSTRPSNHVGLVYEVTPDYIISVQSNTGLKVWHYPVADDGSILGAFSHKIIGFGN